MIKVLFVCYANICRSPALHGIFESLVSESHLTHDFFVDSCALNPNYMGKDIDPRMQESLKKKGYKFSHKSRPWQLSDFEEFDYILAVTKEIKNYLLAQTEAEDQKKRIFLITDFHPEHKGQDIIDPYSMTGKGFDKVLEIIEDVAKSFFDYIKQNDLKNSL